jgi:hypothetical protein
MVARPHPLTRSCGCKAHMAASPGAVERVVWCSQVAADGTVPFRTGERIAFSYLVSQRFVGDTAALEVLREGSVLTVEAR